MGACAHVRCNALPQFLLAVVHDSRIFIALGCEIYIHNTLSLAASTRERLQVARFGFERLLLKLQGAFVVCRENHLLRVICADLLRNRERSSRPAL